MLRRLRALVVEDEPDVRALLCELLSAEGFDAEGAGSLAVARRSLEERLPDLVVLDRRLPDGDGLELCRRLRAGPATRHVPLLMVSCRGRVEERVVGLRSGADDYLAKPFDGSEFAARARALVRRSAEAAARPLKDGDLALDPERHLCLVGERPVRLWPKEFELLRVFLERPGRLLTRDFLAERVWGHARPPSSRAVETAVQRLRRRLGAAGRRLETVRGCGFRLQEEAHGAF